jgi:hypothetical protein
MNNWLTRLRYGVARASASESSGLLKFVEPGAATIAGTIDIVGLVMPEAPDEVVAMNCVVAVEDIETIVRVTFRFRAATEARLDLIGDTLDNSWVKRDAGMLGDVELIMSQWSSGASLGQDGSKRLVRSANYNLTVARPLRNRY